MDRKLIFVALLLLIVIIISLYFTLDENPTPPPAEQIENGEPEEELKEVSFSIYNNAQDHQLILKSREVDNYQGEKRMELEPLQVKVYAADNKELLYTLSGDSGIYYSEEENIELKGNVKIKSDNYYIEAEVLDYYIQDNYLEGRGNVIIEGRQFEAEAEKFSSDLNLRDFKLSGLENKSRAAVYFEEQNND